MAQTLPKIAAVGECAPFQVTANGLSSSVIKSNQVFHDLLDGE